MQWLMSKQQLDTVGKAGHLFLLFNFVTSKVSCFGESLESDTGDNWRLEIPAGRQQEVCSVRENVPITSGWRQGCLPSHYCLVQKR
ncbi:hypothetical protein Nepgr_016153 [Nepenthes gracilis]|uniref:Uncharacterized protein n=1 Tax=Nepenthes gracilis TaxID=150966 RepID=A0AAD3SPM9_NEPGR|nr:hypothetical protein Nepgr_016153 [Nepenthes gracilis]